MASGVKEYTQWGKYALWGIYALWGEYMLWQEDLEVLMVGDFQVL